MGVIPREEGTDTDMSQGRQFRNTLSSGCCCSIWRLGAMVGCVRVAVTVTEAMKASRSPLLGVTILTTNSGKDRAKGTELSEL